MREIIDAGSAILPVGLTARDAIQQSDFFLAVTMAEAAKVVHRRREDVKPERRRVGMPVGHTRVRKTVDDGEVEASWECYTQHVGRTKARTWIENTWN